MHIKIAMWSYTMVYVENVSKHRNAYNKYGCISQHIKEGLKSAIDSLFVPRNVWTYFG